MSSGGHIGEIYWIIMDLRFADDYAVKFKYIFRNDFLRFKSLSFTVSIICKEFSKGYRYVLNASWLYCEND